MRLRRPFCGAEPVIVMMGGGEGRRMLSHAPLLTLERRADTMAMAAPLYYTADLVREMPEDGNRYEVVHGELLVTPAPRMVHQHAVGELFVALHAYLRHEPIGVVWMSPADLSWAPDVLVQPDIFVAPVAQSRGGQWSDIQSLLLAVEVLSPSSARADRFTKRRLYQEAGVPTYWLVDTDRRLAEEWTPDAMMPRVERERLVWTPEGASRPFEMPIASLFSK
jgi:Uma2 family endonuclease